MLQKVAFVAAALVLAAPAHAGMAKTDPATTASMAQAAEANVVETAQSVGQSETLLAAAKAAGLAEALATTENITVFAPTDEAFAKLPEGTVEDLLKPENQEKLAAILQYHVVPSSVMSAEIAEGQSSVQTLGGETLQIVKDSAGVKVGEATVTQADVEASNGVIHVIDTVLMPAY